MYAQPPEIFSEVLDRARKLKPGLASRARAAETLRRLPHETIADLHAERTLLESSSRSASGAPSFRTNA